MSTGVDVLPGPRRRGGEYADELPGIVILLGGGEPSLRGFILGLGTFGAPGPYTDGRECIGGSFNGLAEEYLVGDRIGPEKFIFVVGLRGTWGLLRGGERPSGDPLANGAA